MEERPIEWLKKKKISKKFLIRAEKDRALVNDPDFENWTVSDGQKHVAGYWGRSFEGKADGFTFAAPPPTIEIPPDAPWGFIRCIKKTPAYGRFFCPWEHVTGVHYSDHTSFTYIFVSEKKATR